MSTHTAIYLKLTAVACLWGGTFIAGRMLATEVPHLFAAAGRFVVAAGLLVLIVFWRGNRLPRLSFNQFVLTVLLGATGVFIYNVCFFAALEKLPAGRAALIVSLNPIVTALATALLLRERLRPIRWFGIALALTGAAVVITRGDLTAALGQSVGKGELFMFGAVCAWAAYTIIGRKVMGCMSALAATTYAAIWGGLMLVFGATQEISSIDWALLGWREVLAVLYLGALGTAVAFVWYYQGVQAIGPGRAVVFNNLVPVFGVLLSGIALGEPILVSMLAGGSLVIAGVFVTNWQSGPAK